MKMIQQFDSVGGWFAFLIIFFVVLLVLYFKSMVVVPFNEIHVVSKGKNVYEFDGKGRYAYLPFLYGRTIIPKHVLDIEPGLIKLLDQDNLPFGVEVSVKVQVTDPQKAAATLTRIDHQTVSKVVEDTVMSAARSVAMERNILNIMKKREEIEQAIYRMVADALSKLGLSAIIFDIKNITDIEGSDVIQNLEKVKIAELRKNSRVSEAIHNSEAISVEVEKLKESNVKSQRMKKEEDESRLDREKEVAQKQMLVENEKLKIQEQQTMKLIGLEREKRLAEAKAQADAVEIEAKAQASAIRMRAEAEAESIRQKGFAEADILMKKTEAMASLTKQGNIAGQIKILEILTQAQVQSADKIAEALGKNNKIMYMPMDGEKDLLSTFVPKLDSILQSGIGQDLMNLLKGKQTPAKGTAEKTTQ
jgi:flotillin